jgi:hypothetical protein
MSLTQYFKNVEMHYMFTFYSFRLGNLEIFSSKVPQVHILILLKQN